MRALLKNPETLMLLELSVLGRILKYKFPFDVRSEWELVDIIVDELFNRKGIKLTPRTWEQAKAGLI